MHRRQNRDPPLSSQRREVQSRLWSAASPFLLPLVGSRLLKRRSFAVDWLFFGHPLVGRSKGHMVVVRNYSAVVRDCTPSEPGFTSFLTVSVLGDAVFAVAEGGGHEVSCGLNEAGLQ